MNIYIQAFVILAFTQVSCHCCFVLTAPPHYHVNVSTVVINARQILVPTSELYVYNVLCCAGVEGDEATR